MRDSVVKGFLALTSKREGVCPFMYLDVGEDSGRGRGLVTTAEGNLCPLAFAVTLAFMRPDGTPPTREEIAEEWHLVDSRQDLKLHGGGAFAAITKLRLTPAGIEQIVRKKLTEVDAFMGQRFPGYEQWPAAGQLLVLSMAWAAGSAFRAPRFSAAVNGLDFATAANECHLDDTHNPGLKPRNVADKFLALEAEAVLAAGADCEVLHYPAPFSPDEQPPAAAESGPAADDREPLTEPEVA